MNISSQTTYPATPERVASVFLSEILAAKRMEAFHIDEYTFTSDTTHSTIDVQVAANDIPEQARALAKNGVHVTITTHVDGTHVSYTIDTHGLPIKLELTQKLVNDGNNTRADITGTLAITVPFIGSMLEKKAETYIDAIIEKDAEFVPQVLDIL